MDSKNMDSKNISCISPMQEREQYAELCSLANSGTLTRKEISALNAHVAVCEHCRELLRDFRAITTTGMAHLASTQSGQPAAEDKGWSVDRAKTQLFARIAIEEAAMRPKLVPKMDAGKAPRPFLPSFSLSAFRLHYAAAAALFVLAMALAYRLGENVGIQKEPPATQMASQAAQPAVATNVADAERASAADQLRLQRLQAELKQQSADLADFKAQQKQLEQDRQKQLSAIAALNAEKSSTAAERDSMRLRLEETQAALVNTQQKLDVLREEGSRQLIRTANLQLRVDELSTRLKDNDANLQHDEALLAADREVRELMGARDLYIADVFDIDREGKMQKAFGRVFYTGGKSLIFYAFDLDRQPGVRDTRTYQAWGRRGPGDKRPVNMGALALDNVANKRWSLHVDDPKLLSQVDAVFVTAETHAGVQKPTGKQLLFASLRTPPNHP
jgi:hypothetical protein